MEKRVTYHYLTVFQVLGLQLPSANSNLVLMQNSQEKVTLAKTWKEYTKEVDQSVAISNLLLKGMFAEENARPFMEKVKDEVSLIQQQRSGLWTGPFVIFEMTGEKTIIEQAVKREIDNYVIGFDSIDKASIKDKHKQFIRKVLTALFLIHREDFQLSKVTEGVYLQEGERRYFSYSPSLGPVKLILSSHLPETAAEDVALYATKIGAIPFDTISRLLMQSVEEDDALRGFIFAWNALEIFINKIFNEYKEKFFNQYRAETLPAVAKRYFFRVEDVMQGKFTMVDKFIIIAIQIFTDPDQDIKEFIAVKRDRDKFLHGQEVQDVELQQDLNKIFPFIKKYLRGYLDGLQD